MTVLASGSKGNSTLVASSRTRILVDAGLSCRELMKRMQMANEDPAAIDALLITHEHQDHVQGVAVLARKLGVPGQTELAFGAVSASGGRYLDEYILRTSGITNAQVEWITAEVRKELDRRASVYRGDRPPLDVLGKTVILVDDGVATGASVYAAIQALRQMQPAMLVLAVPVAPASAWEWLRTVVDEIVCLDLPEPFKAVGEFYRDFAQVEDAEVVGLLQRAKTIEKNGRPGR